MESEPGITPPDGTSPQTEPTQTTEREAFTAEAGGPHGSAWNRIGEMVGQRGPWPVAPASFLSQKVQELQKELSVESRVHFSRGGSVSHFLPWALPRTPGMLWRVGPRPPGHHHAGRRISCSPECPRGVWDAHVSPVGCTQLNARSGCLGAVLGAFCSHHDPFESRAWDFRRAWGLGVFAELHLGASVSGRLAFSHQRMRERGVVQAP